MSNRDFDAWVVAVPLAELQQWIAARLAGRDDVVSFDAISDEDPEALFLDLVRNRGYGHPAVDRIATALKAMVQNHAVNTLARLPWFSNYLRMCERITIPHVGEWFIEQLTLLAERVSSSDPGENDLYKLFLLSAARQIPAQSDSAVERLWLSLLQVGHFGEVPLIELSPTFCGRIGYLSSWWRTADTNNRVQQLRAMLRIAHRLERSDDVIASVRAHWLSLPREVVDIIMSVFSPPEHRSFGNHSIANALRDAGLRPELLQQSSADFVA